MLKIYQKYIYSRFHLISIFFSNIDSVIRDIFSIKHGITPAVRKNLFSYS